MKRISFLISFLLCAFVLVAQNQAKSKVGTANVVKKVESIVVPVSSDIKLAILDIVPESVDFVDGNGNKAIDASEQGKLVFQVVNSGTSDGVGCVAYVTATGKTSGIAVQTSKVLDVIPMNVVRVIEMPIASTMETEDGQIELTFQVDEPNGFGTPPHKITIDTRAFVTPFLQVADYTITGSTSVLQRRIPFNLQVLVQNTKYGLAENVTVDIELPSGVLLMAGKQQTEIDQMLAGETIACEYTLAARIDYPSNVIPVKVIIREKYGKYAKDEVITLQLDQNITTTKVQVKSKQAHQQAIPLATINENVEEKKPVQDMYVNKNTFAFVIGNQNYQQLPPVLCASKDADAFAQCCRETLALPAENIHVSKNASLKEMNQVMSQLMQVAKAHPQSHIIFYYAGHGTSDKSGQETFLMPIDAAQPNAATCIRMNDIHNQLQSLVDNRVTIFMDASFVGKNRDDKRFISMSDEQVAPILTVQGSVVEFIASSGAQAAMFYAKEGQGLFTYLLLKKLQETNGEVNYLTLRTFLEMELPKLSVHVNKKMQRPIVNPSITMGNKWQTWTLK